MRRRTKKPGTTIEEGSRDEFKRCVLAIVTPAPHCSVCGVSGVRLYREYGSFRHPETDLCNAHLGEKINWYVPLVLNADGDAWGYTSVPPEDCERFYALPEADPKSPRWYRIGGWRKYMNVQETVELYELNL